jgi:hypothetical protein
MGQELFHYGQEADKMYVVNIGKMTYSSGGGSERPNLDVEVGGWISEMVLWTNWIHRGTLFATCFSELCEIDSQLFQKQVQLRDDIYEVSCRYAQRYVQRLVSLGDENETTDCWGSQDEISELVHAVVDELNVSKERARSGTIWSTVLGAFAAGSTSRVMPDETPEFSSVTTGASLASSPSSRPEPSSQSASA